MTTTIAVMLCISINVLIYGQNFSENINEKYLNHNLENKLKVLGIKKESNFSDPLKNYESKLESDAEKEAVKHWFSEHQDVKLVKRSEFDNSSIAIQNEYLNCSYCLILKGEILSFEDIENLY